MTQCKDDLFSLGYLAGSYQISPRRLEAAVAAAGVRLQRINAVPYINEPDIERVVALARKPVEQEAGK